MKEFSSFAEFATHLVGTVIAVHESQQRALERVGALVEREAKAKIGEYQPQAGEFVAWAPLAWSTIAEKERLGYAPPDNPLLRSGELLASISHEVGVAQVDIGSPSDIAVYQELGTRSIPPRSFLASTAVEQAPKIVELIGGATVIALAGVGVFNGEINLSKYLP